MLLRKWWRLKSCICNELTTDTDEYISELKMYIIIHTCTSTYMFFEQIQDRGQTDFGFFLLKNRYLILKNCLELASASLVFNNCEVLLWPFFRNCSFSTCSIQLSQYTEINVLFSRNTCLCIYHFQKKPIFNTWVLLKCELQLQSPSPCYWPIYFWPLDMYPSTS